MRLSRRMISQKQRKSAINKLCANTKQKTLSCCPQHQSCANGFVHISSAQKHRRAAWFPVEAKCSPPTASYVLSVRNTGMRMPLGYGSETCFKRAMEAKLNRMAQGGQPSAPTKVIGSHHQINTLISPQNRCSRCSTMKTIHTHLRAATRPPDKASSPPCPLPVWRRKTARPQGQI